MAISKNLGQARGLDAIFRTANTGTQVTEKDTVKKVRITEIEPRKEQPRRKFDEDALAQLAESIRSNGVIQPILVRKQPNGFYQIIAGEHCHSHLHLKCIDCGKIIHMASTDSDILLSTIKKSNNFSVNEKETVIFGRCDVCDEK